MRFPRSCGTLVHPTAFPGKYGIGDFGSEARIFLNFLENTGQSIWQVLPLNPPGYGSSPYTSYSAFAGNHYLIAPDILVEKGLLSHKEVKEAELPSGEKVDFERAYANKDRLFKLASKRFYESKTDHQEKNLAAFKQENASWLDDYTLFMASSLGRGLKPWNSWEASLAKRDPQTLDEIKEKYNQEIQDQYWLQFEFFTQWNSLKEYAHNRGIRVVGDIPIYVDHNSADVWANSHFFEVDEEGNRKLVAGVPPDYFSETGQLWGNPLYRWKVLAKDNFSWWVKRFQHMFAMYDVVRVDHFRGFDEYWEVEASQETAEKGRWVQAPGEKLFDTVREKCGELPIIAEDLGTASFGAEKLRDKYNFPGMKVIQFAFDSDSANNFLPHNYPQNCVVYSGTHDNNTSIGWYNSASKEERHKAREYTGSDGKEMNWEFIRLGICSPADQAIFPLQDFMGLGESQRMNTPGTSKGNWGWRYTSSMLNDINKERIKNLVANSSRK